MSVMSGQRVYLPGLSYLPDTLEIAEDSDIRSKITFQFLDFLACVDDLLTLVEAIKLKHMRSVKPLPCDVIREMRNREETKNRTRLTNFEQMLPQLSAGISPSVQSLLGTSSTVSFGRRRMSRTSNTNLTKKITAHNEFIIQKKTKPIWHKIVKEKQETVVDMLAKDRKSSKQRLGEITAMVMSARHDTTRRKTTARRVQAYQQFIPVRREKRVSSDFSIKFATSDRGNNYTPSKRQQDIMDAYAAGFDTVESHNAWQDILQPHWYMDLVKNSIKLGIPQNDIVRKAFSKLSKFFEVNCTTFPMSRAKLCFLVQSLPTWDIMRMPTQQAIEFILRDILMTPKPEKDLRDWMAARHLPYLVLPPRCSDDEPKSGGFNVGTVSDW